MTFWTPQHVQQVTQGRWLTPPADMHAPLTGVTIDSRAVRMGNIFIAVRGERFDGHDFIGAAVANDARVVIVEKTVPIDIAGESSAGVLLVSDTVAALQALARDYRAVLRAAGAKVIAVTGSNGKTTTRQLIHAVLSAQLRGTQSPKSFNNHLGVPLTLLAAAPDDQFIVAEVGTNHSGEIAPLADILQPDIAVITTIGRAHIGNFGSIEAIAREKASLLQFIAPGGCAILPQNVSCAQIVNEAVRDDVNVVHFGDADLASTVAPAVVGNQLHFTLASGTPIILPLLGMHNVHNALAAVAVGRQLGIDDRAAAAALRDMPRPAMRLELTTVGRGDEAITIINDAYNANPESVLAALDALDATFRRGGYRRAVVILGDMLELGDAGPDEHRRVGEAIATRGDIVRFAVLIGRLSMFAAESLARLWGNPAAGERVLTIPAWSDDLPQRIATELRGGDLVLLKGSRGMALERILPAIGSVTC